MKRFIIIGILLVILSISANASVLAREKPTMFGRFRESVDSFLVATHLKSPPKSKMAQYLDDIKLESEKLQDLANENLKTATTAIKGQFKSFKDYVSSSEIAEKTQEYASKAKSATADAAYKVRDAATMDNLKDAAYKAKDATVDAAHKVRDSATIDNLKHAAYEAKDATVDAAYKAKDATLDAAHKVRDSATMDNLKDAADYVKGAATVAGIHKVSDKIQEKMGWKKPTLAQRIFGNKLFGRWESVKDTAEIQAMNLQSNLRKKTMELKDKLNTVMSNEEVEHDEEIQTKASALRESINKLEERVATKAKQLINLFSLGHLFKETPISGHHMHRPFLSCGSCGRLYSLSEFLNTYDPQHELKIMEENFWTDAEVEEFWQGWTEYANHLKLHCTECGSSNWSGVAFSISDDMVDVSNTTLGLDASKDYVEKDLKTETGARHMEL